jgi:hypothetical protein
MIHPPVVVAEHLRSSVKSQQRQAKSRVLDPKDST